MNPYEILGVPMTATPEEIKNAYKQQARILHPDKHVNDPDPTWQEQFQQLQTAYSCLNQPLQRYIYDTTGSCSDTLQHTDFNSMDPSSFVFMSTQSFPIEQLFDNFGISTNMIQMFGSILEPIKERAQQTLERICTKPSTAYEFLCTIEDYWNAETATRPRLKKLTIPETKQRILVSVALGTQMIDTGGIFQGNIKESSSSWIWKWTSTPTENNGYVSYSTNWTYMGFQKRETKWQIHWKSDDSNMKLIWHGTGIAPTIPESESQEWNEELLTGGWLYWNQKRFPWNPHPEAREHGNGWLLKNIGLWYYSELIPIKQASPKRSDVWIPYPILPKLPEWQSYVYQHIPFQIETMGNEFQMNK